MGVIHNRRKGEGGGCPSAQMWKKNETVWENMYIQVDQTMPYSCEVA